MRRSRRVHQDGRHYRARWWPEVGRQAARVLTTFFEQSWGETTGEGKTVPHNYWLVQPAPYRPDGEEQLLLQGAVLVRVRGRRLETGLAQ
jgi:hypothetical protein